MAMIVSDPVFRSVFTVLTIRKWNGVLRALSIAVMLHVCLASAQSLPKVFPAFTNGFVGYWQLIPYDEKHQPKIFPGNLWPGRCQFFGHLPDGQWVYINLVVDESQPCRVSVKEINDYAKNLKVTGRADTYKVVGNFALITRHNAKITEMWKADIVNDEYEGPGFKLRKGDLIMQLTTLEGPILWRRFLRPITEINREGKE